MEYTKMAVGIYVYKFIAIFISSEKLLVIYN